MASADIKLLENMLDNCDNKVKFKMRDDIIELKGKTML
jgi:hypothetical protein